MPFHATTTPDLSINFLSDIAPVETDHPCSSPLAHFARSPECSRHLVDRLRRSIPAWARIRYRPAVRATIDPASPESLQVITGLPLAKASRVTKAIILTLRRERNGETPRVIVDQVAVGHTTKQFDPPCRRR